jgi:hypothetical protein
MSQLIKSYQVDLEWGAFLFVASFLFSIVAVVVVLVRLPVEYFCGPVPPPFWPHAPSWARWTARVVKNLAGAILIAVGLLLSLPGIPGQGLLTILIGLMLLDLGAKRNLEKRIIARPAIFRTVNRLRGYFRRPPLELD